MAPHVSNILVNNFAPDKGLALYVHWPFCVSRCPYCDFNSHVRGNVDQVEWREALLADLAHEAALLPGRRLGSIFFGGGTPSLMDPRTVAAVIDAAKTAWPAHDDLEITLEANPNSAEAARFSDLASAGVNRISLGLQPFACGMGPTSAWLSLVGPIPQAKGYARSARRNLRSIA